VVIDCYHHHDHHHHDHHHQNRGYGGCEIRRFVSSKYSSHMPANADVGAWKAILIKEALNQFPLVIWLDVGKAHINSL